MPQRLKDFRMYCLGGFRFEAEDMPTINFGTQKARALLVYLAIESPREFRRTHLAGLLWSDYSEKNALHNLRQTLVRLRKGWTQGADYIPLLITQKDTITLNPEVGLWVDLLDFENALSRSLTYFQDRQRLEQLDILSLIEAVDLFTGPFLDRFNMADAPLFDEWITLVRERTTKKALKAQTLLCEYFTRRGDYTRAAHLADRIAALVPWDNWACAQAMRLYALQKQWSTAQHHYEQFHDYLERNLDLLPNPAVTELYEEILSLSHHNGDMLPMVFVTNDQIPNLTSSFIGREIELRRLSGMFANPEIRLITIIGRGGVGKTRLVLALALLTRGLFAHRVFFISLRDVSSIEGLYRHMEECLEQSFTGSTNHHRQLIDFLQDKQCLLILDGCEHHLLVGPIRDLLREILSCGPDVKILATSRVRLDLPEEHIFPLAGLDYQRDTSVGSELGQPLDEAVALFESRARQVNPKFNLTPATLPQVQELCSIIEGHPLTIELMASATRNLSLTDLIDDLRKNQAAFDPDQVSLTFESPGLSIVLEHSWKLLTEEERLALCYLVSFKGGFSKRAALQITQTSAEVIANLVEKSLMYPISNERYILHEIIQDFASQKADQRGMLEHSRAKHAQFIVAFLESISSENLPIIHAGALDQIEADLENILAAWSYFIDRKQIQKLKNCIDLLYQFFNTRSKFEEGIHLFQFTLHTVSYLAPFDPLLGILANRLGSLAQRKRQTETAVQMFTRALAIFDCQEETSELGLALIGLGNCHMRAKNFDQALTNGQRALECFQTLGDRYHQSAALYLLGRIHQRAADYPTARGMFTAALAISREIGDKRGLITRLNQLAGHDCNEGDFVSAEKRYLESLSLSRAYKDRYQQAIILNNLASVYHPREEYEEEQSVLEESLAICREIGDRDGEAIALTNLGELAIVLGDHHQALKYCRSALDIALHLGEEWTIIAVYDILGCAYLGLRDFETASQCLSQAIQTAFQVQSWDLLTRSVVNIAEVHLAQEDVDAARELLESALAHPGILYEYGLKAEDLLTGIGVVPPAEKDSTRLLEVLESHFDFK